MLGDAGLGWACHGKESPAVERPSGRFGNARLTAASQPYTPRYSGPEISREVLRKQAFTGEWRIVPMNRPSIPMQAIPLEITAPRPALVFGPMGSDGSPRVGRVAVLGVPFGR